MNKFGVIFLIFVALLLAITPNLHAQLTITSSKLVPNPPVPDATNWLLVNYNGGEVEKILILQGAMRKIGPWGYDPPIEITPAKRLSGKEAGTLKLSHRWREDGAFTNQRSIDLEIQDKQGKKATAKIKFNLASNWKADSPVKLRTITMPPSPAVGKQNLIRISFDPVKTVMVKTLFVEIKTAKGVDLWEKNITGTSLSSGQVDWSWLPKEPGERKFRIWIVDENGNQTNVLESKISL